MSPTSTLTQQSHRPRFHLAFPVDDLDAARSFYGALLGCPEGRSDNRWVDFDFFGHQIVAHLCDSNEDNVVTNSVDGKNVPVRHFGLIVPWPQWERLAARLRGADITFIVEPYMRFNGEAGEQGTFFVADPAGNVLEFKTFRDESQLFAS